MDSNLFKEAIADAKAVRQTALANAKVALEEAFNERYSSLFAEKLKEEAGMEMNPTAQPEMQQEETVSEAEIDELIKEGMAAVGTDEEIVLFSWFSKGEISKADLRYSLYEEARMLVCDEIIEEGLSRDY
jgi:hypothetical protein